jgi:hypothetical protein
MAHYSIFIPNVKGSNPEYLQQVGLGELLREGESAPSAVECFRGPDNLPGMVFGWPIGVGKSVPLGNFPQIKWTPNHDSKFWIGVDPENPPQPIDLIRHVTVIGSQVTLGDGFTWNLPTLSRLPSSYALNRQGELTQIVKDQFKRLYDSSLSIVTEILRQFDMIEVVREKRPDLQEYAIPVSVQDGLKLVADSLAINYRLTFEIAIILGMFDQSSAARALVELVELRELRLVSEQKKNLEPVIIPAGLYS